MGTRTQVCTQCDERKSLDQFHKKGVRRGRQEYRSVCKGCYNDEAREQYRERGGDPWDHKKAYARARIRALTRLSHACPELYDMYLKEEMESEGVEFKHRTSPYARRSVVAS